MKGMKRVTITVTILAFTQQVFGQNEIGPEGHKLLWFVVFVVGLIVLLFVFVKFPNTSHKTKWPFFKKKKVTITLVKDRLYYPDELVLTIANAGNRGVDIDRPLLILSSIWLKRKFRLKGTNNASFYPLYLDNGQSHTLKIDLNRFYSHDKTLKRLPKASVVVYEAGGKRLGSKSVFLRKTLFKF